MKNPFVGVFTALVTPFRDGRLDLPALDALVDRQLAAGVAGLVPCGTTGESPTLSDDEQQAVIARVAARAGGRAQVLAGAGSNSTAHAVHLARRAADAGADGLLVVSPYYNKPTQEGMYRHFCAVADAVEHPVMLYNVPGRTAADLKPATVARLASHPRIMGIKEATGDLARVAELRGLVGEGFALYSGDDATARGFMLLGGQGVVSVTANVAPAAMARMCEAALAGRAAEAAALDQPLSALHRDLFAESNPIPVKWALQRMGRIAGGIRLPLTPLSAAAQPPVEAALRQAGLL